MFITMGLGSSMTHFLLFGFNIGAAVEIHDGPAELIVGQTYVHGVLAGQTYAHGLGSGQVIFAG